MKTKILLFFTILSLMGCSSDDTTTPQQKLPPATTTGANTFGCLIDGKILLPRSGNTSQINPLYGGRLTRGYPDDGFDYYELEIIDHKSTPRASLFFHMHNAPVIRSKHSDRFWHRCGLHHYSVQSKYSS